MTPRKHKSCVTDSDITQTQSARHGQWRHENTGCASGGLRHENTDRTLGQWHHKTYNVRHGQWRHVKTDCVSWAVTSRNTECASRAHFAAWGEELAESLEREGGYETVVQCWEKRSVTVGRWLGALQQQCGQVPDRRTWKQKEVRVKTFFFWLYNLQILTLFWPINFLRFQLKCGMQSISSTVLVCFGEMKQKLQNLV